MLEAVALTSLEKQSGSSQVIKMWSPKDINDAIAALSPPSTGLGVGQTWQDVTASRAMGVIYTNSTGRSIAILASASRNTFSTSGLNITITQNGVSLGMLLCYNSNSSGSNTAAGGITIPSGATYSLTVASEPLTSYKVYELR